MFQSFDVQSDPSLAAARVADLRAELRRADVAAFLIPRADAHQGEYVAPADERLKWLTGFSGSAGLAVVTATKAAVIVDGRYTIQAASEVDQAIFDAPKFSATAAGDWLIDTLKSGSVVGFDPWLHTALQIERLSERLETKAIRLKPVPKNLVDKVWGRVRPAAPAEPVVVQPLTLAGRTPAEKIADVQKVLQEAGQSAVVLTLPECVCWLFNIRGSDVAHNPVALSFAIVPATGKPELFIAPEKLGKDASTHLKAVVKISAPATLKDRLAALKVAKKPVRLDPASAAFWFFKTLGSKAIQRGVDPCLALKAIKNTAELKGARAAHVRDGLAMATFLTWLGSESARGTDEITAATKLEECRQATGALRDISFDTIAGSGPHGAIVHYRVNTATNRKLKSGELFLIDSGAQYQDGTTDITRTVAIGKPTADMRDRFTRVLKGHIAIATARFPEGTRGVDLDPFARRALWDAGLDYAHGTGHGIGSYLSVHEGPQSISRAGMVALLPGMICSNEPGYYKTDAYGIRIENLVVVTAPQTIPNGDAPMLGFETLTLAPIDRSLIDLRLLSETERGWIDSYHAQVWHALKADTIGEVTAWLKAATAKL